MRLNLVYFAWVREAVGRDTESVEVPATLGNVAGLIGWLHRRGEGYQTAFAHPDRVRAAVDGAFVGHDAPLHDGQEIALFPPVTGG